jgi:phosphatidylinositol alpha-1,6-mannosyltransferase
MPSRLPADGLAGEGFGIVYLEAAAHGVPVVAGNVAGALDAVADGESGLLVDPTDSRAVAGALSSLLLDGELATRLGRAGAERAKRFAWPSIAARLEAVLLDLVAHQRGGAGPPPP